MKSDGKVLSLAVLVSVPVLSLSFIGNLLNAHKY